MSTIPFSFVGSSICSREFRIVGDLAHPNAAHGGGLLTTEEALRETRGHPYLLSRLLERGARLDGPVELATVLAGELAQLDPDARSLLELVAVAGGPIAQRAAFTAAGLRPNPATVDQLRRRRLIHATSTADAQLEAYHDRVRDIALAAISDDRQRELHLEIANALEHSDVAEAETLARHYRAGADRPKALAQVVTWRGKTGHSASQATAA